MTHYRVPFFETLRTELWSRGLELVLAYGVGTATELAKHDEGIITWAKPIATRYFFRGRVCWQPFSDLVADASVIVITAENKLLYNLIIQWFAKHSRVILWGHGGNLQGDPASLRERFKRWVALKSDWWFGYTEHSRPLIIGTGFPSSRMTMLNNSVDTNSMKCQRRNVTPTTKNLLTLRLGLSTGPTGIFVGSLYTDKRIDFVINTAVALRSKLPNFQMLFVGAGPQRELVETFCASCPWARYLGVLTGQDKVDAICQSNVIINPGLVGLGILDSFCCGVPLVTTDCGLHSPEIAYLQSGRNGLMVADDFEAYVDAVQQVLVDEDLNSSLTIGCLESAEQYTIAEMARRFGDGIIECLHQPIRRF